jgi:trk system potassium uptake protein TrkA
MKRRRKVCVIGLGHFGAALARALARHCEVLALDRNTARVNEISDEVQRALAVDARDFHALSAVVSPDFDEAIVSIGEGLEASILSTLHLRRIGVKVIRAKAMSADHAEILRAVGAAQVIFPEQEAADRLAVRILNPNLLDYLPLAQDYRVMDVSAPADFVGHTLVQLQLRKRFGVFVIAIKRNGSDFVFLPNPDEVIDPRDVLVLIGRESDILALPDVQSQPPAGGGTS